MRPDRRTQFYSCVGVINILFTAIDGSVHRRFVMCTMLSNLFYPFNLMVYLVVGLGNNVSPLPHFFTGVISGITYLFIFSTSGRYTRIKNPHLSVGVKAKFTPAASASALQAIPPK